MGLLKKAFQAVYKLLWETPIRALPDFSNSFEVECDVSGVGSSDYLVQIKIPIAYFSKNLDL